MMLGDSERSIAFKVHTVEFGDECHGSARGLLGLAIVPSTDTKYMNAVLTKQRRFFGQNRLCIRLQNYHSTIPHTSSKSVLHKRRCYVSLYYKNATTSLFKTVLYNRFRTNDVNYSFFSSDFFFYKLGMLPRNIFPHKIKLN